MLHAQRLGAGVRNACMSLYAWVRMGGDIHVYSHVARRRPIGPEKQDFARNRLVTGQRGRVCLDGPCGLGFAFP